MSYSFDTFYKQLANADSRVVFPERGRPYNFASIPEFKKINRAGDAGLLFAKYTDQNNRIFAMRNKVRNARKGSVKPKDADLAGYHRFEVGASGGGAAAAPAAQSAGRGGRGGRGRGGRGAGRGGRGGRGAAYVPPAHRKAQAVKYATKNPAQIHMASVDAGREKLAAAKKIKQNELPNFDSGDALKQIANLQAQKRVEIEKAKEALTQVRGGLAAGSGKEFLDRSLKHLGATSSINPMLEKNIKQGFNRPEAFRQHQVEKLIDKYRAYEAQPDEAKRKMGRTFKRDLYTRLAMANSNKDLGADATVLREALEGMREKGDGAPASYIESRMKHYNRATDLARAKNDQRLLKTLEQSRGISANDAVGILAKHRLERFNYIKSGADREALTNAQAEAVRRERRRDVGAVTGSQAGRMSVTRLDRLITKLGERGLKESGEEFAREGQGNFNTAVRNRELGASSKIGEDIVRFGQSARVRGEGVDVPVSATNPAGIKSATRYDESGAVRQTPLDPAEQRALRETQMVEPSFRVKAAAAGTTEARQNNLDKIYDTKREVYRRRWAAAGTTLKSLQFNQLGNTNVPSGTRLNQGEDDRTLDNILAFMGDAASGDLTDDFRKELNESMLAAFSAKHESLKDFSAAVANLPDAAGSTTFAGLQPMTATSAAQTYYDEAGNKLDFQTKLTAELAAAQNNPLMEPIIIVKNTFNSMEESIRIDPRNLPKGISIYPDPVMNNPNVARDRNVSYVRSEIGGRPVYYGHPLKTYGKADQDMSKRPGGVSKLLQYAYAVNMEDSLSRGRTGQEAVDRIGSRDFVKQGDKISSVLDESTQPKNLIRFPHPLRIYDANMGMPESQAIKIPQLVLGSKKNPFSAEELRFGLTGGRNISQLEINPGGQLFNSQNYSRLEGVLMGSEQFLPVDIQRGAAGGGLPPAGSVGIGYFPGQGGGLLRKTDNEKKLQVGAYKGQILVPQGIASSAQEEAIGAPLDPKIVRNALKLRMNMINATPVGAGSFAGGSGTGVLRKTTVSAAPVSDPNAFTNELRARSNTVSNQMTREERRRAANRALLGLTPKYRHAQITYNVSQR